MGVEYDDANKSVLKNALYALIYGAADETLTQHLGQHYPVASAAFTRFTSHAIIRSLLKARAAAEDEHHWSRGCPRCLRQLDRL